MKTNEERLEDLLSHLNSLGRIHVEDIPKIDLYMDQVTTFMESHLESMKRYPDDKVLTKTMINNYAKNNLLPPPVRKKYTQEHILLLILKICLISTISRPFSLTSPNITSAKRRFLCPGSTRKFFPWNTGRWTDFRKMCGKNLKLPKKSLPIRRNRSGMPCSCLPLSANWLLMSI